MLPELGKQLVPDQLFKLVSRVSAISGRPESQYHSINSLTSWITSSPPSSLPRLSAHAWRSPSSASPPPRHLQEVWRVAQAPLSEPSRRTFLLRRRLPVRPISAARPEPQAPLVGTKLRRPEGKIAKASRSRQCSPRSSIRPQRRTS